MTEADVNRLAATGETDTAEFKKTTGEKDAGCRTLCGMLNGSGGRVLFGVTPTGKVLGQDVSDSTQIELAQAYAHFEPPAPIQQESVTLGNGRVVLVVSVVAGGQSPYTFQGRPYQRVNTTTSTLPQAEYQRRLLERNHPTRRWENLPASQALALDQVEIGRTLTDAVAAGRLESAITDPAHAVEKLGLVVGGQISQAAVVAFALEPFPEYPQCALRLARFRGVTKAEFLDQQQLTGHAFRLLREADAFLKRHLPTAGRFEPGVLERKDEPLFPPLALREALVNALVHRDYSIPGGAVSVAVYDNRLEITSTGTLPFGLTVADLRREHVSKPRNPLLAELFYRRGLIEKWGRGTQKIIDLCVAAGHPEPEFVESAGDFTVRFTPSGYVAPHRVEQNLTDRQRRVLHILSKGSRLAASAIRAELDANLAERTLRDDLQMLRELQLIDTSGRGPGARWWLI